MANNINRSTASFDISTFDSNTQYLNWPGLQYLFYTKIKPMIKNAIGDTKNMKDDENWYASYDVNSGEVYLVMADDNQVFYHDYDGSCGSIDMSTGMLMINVDRDRSMMIDGFIDDRIGSIGIDGYKSDEIGHGTGKLFVNFDRAGRIICVTEDEPGNGQ